MPGEVDLSAYVNFSLLKLVANSYDELKTVGPIPQGFFLESMGIATRVQYLASKNSITKAKQLESEYERLASAAQMGEVYKFLYTGSKSLGEVYPFLESLNISKKE